MIKYFLEHAKERAGEGLEKLAGVEELLKALKEHGGSASCLVTGVWVWVWVWVWVGGWVGVSGWVGGCWGGGGGGGGGVGVGVRACACACACGGGVGWGGWVYEYVMSVC